MNLDFKILLEKVIVELLLMNLDFTILLEKVIVELLANVSHEVLSTYARNQFHVRMYTL